jgi:beta-glucosidase
MLQDAGLLSVMCSYNKVQLASEQSHGGLFSCENPLSLQRDLKERMNFSGFVLSDYGGTHSMSINAGLDQEMPGYAFLNASGINASLASGALSMGKLDDSAQRILAALFAVGLFDKPNSNTPANNMATPEHHAIAGELAAAGTVLLKNAGALLPLKLPGGAETTSRTDLEAPAPYTIAVIGHEAIGVTVAGGGSGHVVPANLTGPLAAIRSRAGIAGNTSCNAAGSVCVRFQDVTQTSDIAGAVALAKASSVSLVFVATSSQEGIDRSNLSLSAACQSTAPNCASPLPVDQDALIDAVVAVAGAKTAVVAVCPGALLTPWAAQAAAVLVPSPLNLLRELRLMLLGCIMSLAWRRRYPSCPVKPTAMQSPQSSSATRTLRLDCL